MRLSDITEKTGLEFEELYEKGIISEGIYDNKKDENRNSTIEDGDYDDRFLLLLREDVVGIAEKLYDKGNKTVQSINNITKNTDSPDLLALSDNLIENSKGKLVISETLLENMRNQVKENIHQHVLNNQLIFNHSSFSVNQDFELPVEQTELVVKMISEEISSKLTEMYEDQDFLKLLEEYKKAEISNDEEQKSILLTELKNKTKFLSNFSEIESITENTLKRIEKSLCGDNKDCNKFKQSNIFKMLNIENNPNLIASILTLVSSVSPIVQPSIMFHSPLESSHLFNYSYTNDIRMSKQTSIKINKFISTDESDGIFRKKNEDIQIAIQSIETSNETNKKKETNRPNIIQDILTQSVNSLKTHPKYSISDLELRYSKKMLLKNKLKKYVELNDNPEISNTTHYFHTKNNKLQLMVNGSDIVYEDCSTKDFVDKYSNSNKIKWEEERDNLKNKKITEGLTEKETKRLKEVYSELDIFFKYIQWNKLSKTFNEYNQDFKNGENQNFLDDIKTRMREIDSYIDILKKEEDSYINQIEIENLELQKRKLEKMLKVSNTDIVLYSNIEENMTKTALNNLNLNDSSKFEQLELYESYIKEFNNLKEEGLIFPNGDDMKILNKFIKDFNNIDLEDNLEDELEDESKKEKKEAIKLKKLNEIFAKFIETVDRLKKEKKYKYSDGDIKNELNKRLDKIDVRSITNEEFNELELKKQRDYLVEMNGAFANNQSVSTDDYVETIIKENLLYEVIENKNYFHLFKEIFLKRDNNKFIKYLDNNIEDSFIDSTVVNKIKKLSFDYKKLEMMDYKKTINYIGKLEDKLNHLDKNSKYYGQEKNQLEVLIRNINENTFKIDSQSLKKSMSSLSEESKEKFKSIIGIDFVYKDDSNEEFNISFESLRKLQKTSEFSEVFKSLKLSSNNEFESNSMKADIDINFPGVLKEVEQEKENLINKEIKKLFTNTNDTDFDKELEKLMSDENLDNINEKLLNSLDLNKLERESLKSVLSISKDDFVKYINGVFKNSINDKVLLSEKGDLTDKIERVLYEEKSSVFKRLKENYLIFKNIDDDSHILKIQKMINEEPSLNDLTPEQKRSLYLDIVKCEESPDMKRHFRYGKPSRYKHVFGPNDDFSKNIKERSSNLLEHLIYLRRENQTQFVDSDNQIKNFVEQLIQNEELAKVSKQLNKNYFESLRKGFLTDNSIKLLSNENFKDIQEIQEIVYEFISNNNNKNELSLDEKKELRIRLVEKLDKEGKLTYGEKEKLLLDINNWKGEGRINSSNKNFRQLETILKSNEKIEYLNNAFENILTDKELKEIEAIKSSSSDMNMLSPSLQKKLGSAFSYSNSPGENSSVNMFNELTLEIVNNPTKEQFEEMPMFNTTMNKEGDSFVMESQQITVKEKITLLHESYGKRTNGQLDDKIKKDLNLIIDDMLNSGRKSEDVIEAIDNYEKNLIHDFKQDNINDNLDIISIGIKNKLVQKVKELQQKTTQELDKMQSNFLFTLFNPFSMLKLVGIVVNTASEGLDIYFTGRSKKSFLISDIDNVRNTTNGNAEIFLEESIAQMDGTNDLDIYNIINEKKNFDSIFTGGDYFYKKYPLYYSEVSKKNEIETVTNKFEKSNLSKVFQYEKLEDLEELKIKNLQINLNIDDKINYITGKFKDLKKLRDAITNNVDEGIFDQFGNKFKIIGYVEQTIGTDKTKLAVKLADIEDPIPVVFDKETSQYICQFETDVRIELKNGKIQKDSFKMKKAGLSLLSVNENMFKSEKNEDGEVEISLITDISKGNGYSKITDFELNQLSKKGFTEPFFKVLSAITLETQNKQQIFDKVKSFLEEEYKDKFTDLEDDSVFIFDGIEVSIDDMDILKDMQKIFIEEKNLHTEEDVYPKDIIKNVTVYQNRTGNLDVEDAKDKLLQYEEKTEELEKKLTEAKSSENPEEIEKAEKELLFNNRKKLQPLNILKNDIVEELKLNEDLYKKDKRKELEDKINTLKEVKNKYIEQIKIYENQSNKRKDIKIN